MKEVSYIQRNPMAPKDAWDSLSIADKAAMMRVAVQNGITNLDDIRAKYNEFAEGGNIHAGGSYMPSEGIKKRISKWEGKAMTGAKDPLSGKFLKNNSFESEAVAFTRALPESIREQVLNNPELADNLFSYSYNVGAPKFKKRVVKALEDYYAGKGTAKKIADSMWASGDVKLRGLRNRRAEEKKGVMNALKVDIPAMQVPELPVSTAVVNPFIIPAENTTFFPQVTPIEDNYVEVQEITPEQRRAEQVRNTFDAINNYNMMMDMLSVPNNPQLMYVPKNAPYVVRGFGGPIVEAAMNEYKKGGGIHIKHPGRLTALKKRTGKTETELYNDGNPAHKKMVVFARNARKWKHDLGGNLFSGEEEGSQQMITTHKPYYDRDGMLLYNRTLPETVIIPDSQLSPAERNYRERQRQRNLPDYAQHKDREITARQMANARKEWENSFEKQALDYGQAIASGVGMGADMVSRLPIYSSLKGASTLSRAETPLDYVESGLWLAPIVSTVGKTAYDAAKPVVSEAANMAMETAAKGKRFVLDVGDRYQGMKDAAAYRSANGNMDARTIANMKWWENGGTPTGINRAGVSNYGDFRTYYLYNPENPLEGHYSSPIVEGGGNMTLTTHLGGATPGDITQEILPMGKSEMAALSKYLRGVPENTYLGEVGKTKNYAEQYFNVKPSRMKAFKDAVHNKKEINEPYWNEKEHIEDFMDEENPIEKAFFKHLYEANEPLSADSYKLVLQEAAKDNGRFALRYDSSPMGMFNPQGVYENEFYNSLQSLAPREQVNAINTWMKSYYPKARSSYLKNGKVMIPRPLLMIKGKQ